MPADVQIAQSKALEAARLNPEKSLQTGQGSARQAILMNASLGAAKLLAGVFGHSYALVADAAESFSDVLGSCVTLYGLKLAARPADSTHPAGHGRAETIAAGATALALCAVGTMIFITAFSSLKVPRLAPHIWTLMVLVPVILIKETLFHRMHARGDKTGSLALIADAWHQRSDVVTSVAAFGGILVAWYGGPSWSHADSWAAMLASVWLVVTGLWLLGPTVHEFMEGSVDPALLDFIRTVSMKCEGVRGIDKVWVRKLGMRLMVDLHVEVDPQLSVLKGHELAHLVKDKLQAELPQVRNVMVHVEPYDSSRDARPYRKKVQP